MDNCVIIILKMHIGLKQQASEFVIASPLGRTPGWPLCPFGAFTFWQSPCRMLQICTPYQEIPTSLRSSE